MKRGFADTKEGQIHFVEDGQGDPLVLLHQSPRSSRMYGPILPLLAKHYRVIAMDTLGCGSSGPPPANFKTADLAQAVVHFLDALHIEKYHLFGLKTGTVIAAEVAAAWPTRLATLVLFGFPLVLSEAEVTETHTRIRGQDLPWESSLDGSHWPKLWMRAYSDVLKKWWHGRTMGGETLQPTTLQSVHSSLSPEELQFMGRWVLDLIQAREYSRQITRAVFSYDAPARLPLIKAPTFHIEGDSPFENYFCRRGAAFAKMVHQCETAVLPNSDGNAAEFQAPALAKLILDFVRKHPL